MSEKRFDTNDTPHVMIQDCQGDVSIGSWIREAVTVTGESFTAASPEANLVTVTSAANMQIMLPAHSRLTIETIQGSLTIKHVGGLTKIGQVQGDLILKNVGDVQVDVIHGTLNGEGVDGPLHIDEAMQSVTLRNTHDVDLQRVGEGVSIRYVNGGVSLGHVNGDIDLHTISEDVTISQASGTVKLSNLGGQNSLPQVQGMIFLVGGLVSGEHTFTSQSDIYVYWPSHAPVNLIATASKISNRLRLRQAGESTEGDMVTLTGFIEHRKTFLVLKTPTRIGLVKWDHSGEPAFATSDFDFTEPPAPVEEAETITPVVAANTDISTAVSQGVTHVINRLELELGPEWGRRFAALELEEKFTEAITAEFMRAGLPTAPISAAETAVTPPADTPVTPGVAAFHKAEHKVEKSLQKATTTMEKTRQRLTAPETTPPTKVPSPPETAAPSPPEAQPTAAPDTTPPPSMPNNVTPSAQPAAQLRILDMLEKGVISVEEASKLLQSL